VYWYLENDREELVGGRKDQILRQPQIRARNRGLTTVQRTGTLRMTEKSLLVGGRTRSSGSLSSGPGTKASPSSSILKIKPMKNPRHFLSVLPVLKWEVSDLPNKILKGGSMKSYDTCPILLVNTCQLIYSYSIAFGVNIR
jgi:hypothetical protein